MLRSYDYKCEKCQSKEIRLAEMDDRDRQLCERCSSLLVRMLSVPHIRTDKTSASFIDGQRAKGAAFSALRRQSYLEDVIFDTSDTSEKQEAQKELDSIINK